MRRIGMIFAIAWFAISMSSCAQQDDDRANDLLGRMYQDYTQGRYDQALAKVQQVISLRCSARWRGAAYRYQGEIRLKRNDRQGALESCRQALRLFDQALAEAAAARDGETQSWVLERRLRTIDVMQRAGLPGNEALLLLDQAYNNATAAKRKDDQAKVLQWRMRTVRGMLEVGPSGDEARRCYGLFKEYLEAYLGLSRTGVMPAELKLVVEADVKAIDRLWAGMPYHYLDVLEAARRLYDVGEHQECLSMIATWSSPPQAPKDATNLDAAEGFRLRAMCLCQLSLQEPDQARAADLVEQARALFVRTGACSDAMRTEGQRVLATAAARIRYAATLAKAWELYESRAFADCREMLTQWARPGQAPQGASPSQAAEGFNLRACCLCRLAAGETEQTKFADMITQATALFQSAAGCSEKGKTEGEVALKDAIDNRYDGRLREARTQYDAGALDEALVALEPWTHPDPLPVGATEDQNARGFHLRALCLCRKAALGGDDATCEGMINDAKTLFPYGHALQVEQRAEGQAMLRAALMALGKARFARQLYGRAYLNLKEANDLQDSIELRFLLAECPRLDTDKHAALNSPEFLRGSIHDYQQVISFAPNSSQGRQSIQRLPEVVRRCNQTALMQLEPGAWGDRGEFVEAELQQHYDKWWRPDEAAAAKGGPGFLFDCVIEATTLDDAAAIARERGDMWLLRVTSPKLATDPAGVIIGASFKVEVHNVLEGGRVSREGFRYKGKQAGKTGTAGSFADQLLAQLRSQFLTDVIERVPELLGTRVPVAQ